MIRCLALLTLLLEAVGALAGPVRTFPLGDVQLLDSRFKANMERNAAYLLSLDPDRFLHNTRLYAGLKPKGELYGGWESLGIAGHSLGHYLTALSQQYAATGDKRFRDRIDCIVAEMAECQKAYGDGYIGALPPRELSALRALKTGNAEMKGAWVPWYTEHKILAGLKDAWVLGGNAQAKEVALKLADWVDDVTAKLTPEQQQQMLRIEFGGMNETLIELSQLTGNPKYLEVSRRFYHQAVMDPLLAGRDELPGKHANTQIPKVIGEAVRYEATGEPEGRKIAENFWRLVTSRYTFALGGNSDREHFFPMNQAAAHLGPETAETCNAYNMLKLTEHLFEWKPEAAYGDYYEQVLYNQILASQEPDHGMFTYFISLKPGHFRTYSTPENSFWCCVGTGMENHTKYGEAIYFHGPTDFYVNLFIPSVLQWKEKGLVLEQKTGYPKENTSELTIQAAPATALSLHVRCPGWAAAPLTFRLNGQPLTVDAKPGSFATISRVWSKGDRLEVTIPMSLRAEPLEGAPDKVAFFYGPILLAADLGRVPVSKNYPSATEQRVNDLAPTVDVPTLVAEEPAEIIHAIHPIPGEPLAFRTEGAGHPDDITLRPFSDLMYNYYNVYWSVLSPAEWHQHEAEMEAAAAKQREEEARIVDTFQPGEQQSEVDHGLASDHSQTGDFRDRKWRDARGWFEFQLKVRPGVSQVLRATYCGDDTRRKFDVLVEGDLLATQELTGSKRGQFFDVEYPLPAKLLAGKDKVTIRFQAKPGSIAGGLFGGAILQAATQASP